MAQRVIKDIRDDILFHLKKNGQKLPWLAKQTGISYAHLYFILKKKERKLTEENKQLINSTLKTNF